MSNKTTPLKNAMIGLRADEREAIEGGMRGRDFNVLKELSHAAFLIVLMLVAIFFEGV